ncbi:uncharacterized protein AB675_3077 [Cyphellophora attinorum]|uniref:Uncharacterized protein n=1 Tax=Cyphellophora attinorum TaxID=1664694 RepID=A0A0N1H7W2_9EURO|nr:uncharacterized protein AB675_3077 [Phialophora attinorum]KPI37817.1 hypothetical protein AB675_3077 [Phialophora attinorum]
MDETSSIVSQRPPSPVPSYHTLPPEAHTVLLAGPSSSAAGPCSPSTSTPSRASIPNALLSAARNTPDAVLSTLTLTHHHSDAGSSPPEVRMQGNRYLSARTADGRERYRVSFSSQGRSVIWRAADHASSSTGTTLDGDSRREALAVIKPIDEHGGDAGQGGLAVYLFGAPGARVSRLEYDTLRDTGNLPLPMLSTTTIVDAHGQQRDRTADDEEAGLQWEVTTHADFPSTSSNVSLADSIDDGRRRSAHAVLRDPHRRFWAGRSWGLGEDGGDPLRDKRSKQGKGKGKEQEMAALSGLHLVDADYNVYADYAHKVAESDLDRDGQIWGHVRFRARAVLLDVLDHGGGSSMSGRLGEKMDHVFLTLVLLLQACVRVD